MALIFPVGSVRIPTGLWSMVAPWPASRPIRRFYTSPARGRRGRSRDPRLRGHPQHRHERRPRARRADRARLRAGLVRPTARSSGGSTCPTPGDELHHFGWNACSSALCPWAPHPHVERRYLLVPGLRSSKIHVVDVKDDPASPKIVKVIEAEEIARKAGYSRPHTIHCGPDGIYVSALGNPEGDGPGRHLPARPRRLQRQGRLGGRPRPAGAGLRLLVAPRLRHAADQRVGHAEHGRGRAPGRAAARQQVRPQAARVGPQEAHPPAGDRPRRRAPDGARAAPGPRRAQGLRLRRRRHLDRRPVAPRCGCGSAPTTARSARAR